MLGVARSGGGAACPVQSWATASGASASKASSEAVASKAAALGVFRGLDRTRVMAALWHFQAEANLKFGLSLASGSLG
jgi:hypothetical protein